MDRAKIRLSPWEAELVSDSKWILTKNAILAKARMMLEDAQLKQVDFFRQHPILPAELLSIPPKISRGEYYQGLPYLILDYPRQFRKEGVFAIRTMFWWGHFFSLTLHISGESREQYLDYLDKMFPEIKENFFICINEEEWEHHFDESNYRALAGMNEEEYRQALHSGLFVKLARRIPLPQWEEANDLIHDSFCKITRMLAGQFPSR